MSLPVLGLIVWFIYRATRGAKADATSRRKIFASVVALFIWLYGSFVTLRAIGELCEGHLLALPKLLAGLVVLFPWLTLRALVMPLGLVRTAYYLSFLCTLRFEEDRRGGALMLGAWTLLRTPEGGGAALRFIDQRLTRLKQLRGGAVVATALVAARRDELAVTRALLKALPSLDPSTCPSLAYMLASEWQCVDAVTRGDWPQLAALTSSWGPYLPLTRFLGDCACRFRPLATEAEPPAQPGTAPPAALPSYRPPPPSNRTLWWHWLLAPYRQATWPLLQRALHGEPQAPAESPPTAPRRPHGPPTLRQAMAELVTLLKAPTDSLSEAQILQVCRFWDAVLGDPATHRDLARRILSLGQGDPDAALRDLRAQVADLLGSLLQESGLPIGQLLSESPRDAGAPPLSVTAAHAVRAQLLGEIEQGCDALHDRTTDQRALPLFDEWRQWATLLASYQRVSRLGGLGIRRLAWAPLHLHACNWAVWLWNERKEKVLANAVFRFLLSEAEELGDESRIALDRKNVGAGI